MRRHPPRFAFALVWILPILAATLGFSACTSAQKSPESEIVISAAASLKDAFGEIGAQFRASTGVKATFNFGSSGELEKQIELGAPADVFASAGEAEMDRLASKNLIDSASRGDFAGNALVVVVPASATVVAGSFSDLGKPNYRKISVGNPKTVPAGHYAQDALEKSHLWSAVSGRLIFAENVRQVLEYVARGEVDAGLVYSTDVAVAGGGVTVLAEAPEGTYGPIRYPIAVVRGSNRAEIARQFVQFVLGTQGQATLKKFGFSPAK